MYLFTLFYFIYNVIYIITQKLQDVICMVGLVIKQTAYVIMPNANPTG